MSAEQRSQAEKAIAEAIGAAEEIRSPLDDLVERTAADPGAAFTPEVLELLAALKQGDPADFERLRAQLKKAGCRVTELDEIIATKRGEASRRGPSDADLLVELAQTAELFYAPDLSAFADLYVNGHRETWPVRSDGFKLWLARRYYEEAAGAVTPDARNAALNVIEAKARYEGHERDVHVRVGGLGGCLYLDLCDADWRAVEIDAGGWRVVESPPVRFRRAAGMQALPAPNAETPWQCTREIQAAWSTNLRIDGRQLTDRPDQRLAG